MAKWIRFWTQKEKHYLQINFTTISCCKCFLHSSWHSTGLTGWTYGVL